MMRQAKNPAIWRRLQALLFGMLVGLVAIAIWLMFKHRARPENPIAAESERVRSAWVVPRFVPDPHDPPSNEEPAQPDTRVISTALVVHVQDVTGGPILAATIKLGNREVGATGGNGTLVIEPAALNLPAAGELFVEARGYGSGQAYYNSPGVVIVKLIPASSISGIAVAKETGRPLAGIAVSTGSDATATSDEQGRFTLGDVKPGTYRLSGSGLDRYGAIEQAIAIGPAMAVSGLVLEMSRGYAIRGRVTEGELPMVGVMVYGAEGHSFTDDKGRFEITGVPPGDYELRLNLGDLKRLFYELDSQTKVSVVDHDVTADIVLVPRASLTLEAVDQAGRPQPRVPFDIRQKSASLDVGSTCTSGDDGRCTVEGLVRGTVLVRLNDEPYREISVPVAGERPIRFITRDAVVLAGRIVRADGGPVGRRYIGVSNEAANFSDAMTTTADGSFRFHRVAPGDLDINVWPRNGLAAGDAIEASLKLVLAHGIDREDLIIELPAQDQHVAGVVLDDGGAPAADVLITCIPGSYFSTLPDDTTVSDNRGRFRCENLRPGFKYKIDAITSGGAFGQIKLVPVGSEDAQIRLAKVPGG